MSNINLVSPPRTAARLKGTYNLLLHLGEERQLTIGRLGRFRFEPGYYVYSGSALAGLTSRLERHRRLSKKPHWHIDYLLPWVTLDEVWVVSSPERLECICSRLLCRLSGASIAVPGFGSSDCRCPSHLVYFSSPPSLITIAETLQRERPDSPCLQRWEMCTL
ncbi:MAG: GIY-YIG nuclease family protein [Chloroflexi bacterium]|nr:GIY-YIG nuclease family protein [Chloroflexota bacterium]MCL5075237.1 GIY-YIG nuclease family protein [Chloroflexota bacterium]